MVAKLIPPVVLIVLAMAQVGRSRTVDLTAWKGGGFGMFATLDHDAYRGVDVTSTHRTAQSRWRFLPSLETAAARAAACPTDWVLRALAEGGRCARARCPDDTQAQILGQDHRRPRVAGTR